MSEEKNNSGGIRRTTGLCERSAEQEEEEKTTFVPSAVSVPLKPLCRCDKQYSEKTLIRSVSTNTCRQKENNH